MAGDNEKQNNSIEKWGDVLASFLIFSIVVGCTLFGALEGVDRFIAQQRFAWLSEIKRSDAVIVAIDSKSLQEMPDWPWPRARHGALVDALNAAGARRIAFDVDFSAPGSADDRAAFAESLQRSESPVILAAFRQSLSADITNVIAEITPSPAFRQHAEIAAVNYPVDRDGVVRSANASVEFSFGSVPSMAFAVLDQTPQHGGYGVDFAISPDSFPIYSYADVLAGRYPPGAFDEKAVFVGATALELGDEYVIPVYGRISGVLLNALSYETIRRNRQIGNADMPPILIFCGALVLVLTAHSVRSDFRKLLGVQIAVGVIILGSSLIALDLFKVNASIAPALAAQMLCGLYAFALELERRARKTYYAHLAAREKSALVEMLISDNHEGFIVADDEGVIELCNKRAADFLQWKGLPLGERLAECAPGLAAHVNAAAKKGDVAKFEYEAGVKDDGDISVLDVTVSRSILPAYASRFERRKAERVFVVYALHDISAQKRAELAERRAKESHAAISAAKSQLISNMSHELKTPLSAIIGFSEILMNESFGALGAPEYHEYARQIHKGGQNLLFILNDLIQSAKLQSGDAPPETDYVSPADLIDQSILDASARPHWGKAKIDIQIDPVLKSVRADFSQLQLALTHIIDNAAKFGGPKALIKIKAMYYKGFALLRVQDNGPGCAAEELTKLTEIFYQVDGSLKRQFEGCGLGLFLAARIAELHGGRLALRSAAGEGFEACLVLPKAMAAGAAEQAA